MMSDITFKSDNAMNPSTATHSLVRDVLPLIMVNSGPRQSMRTWQRDLTIYQWLKADGDQMSGNCDDKKD